jgi:peptidyl-prolyl cis-trans isomerase A (cyclophilin A)
MRRLIDGIWKQLRKQSPNQRETPLRRARLCLESLETRLTPTVSATGVITGQLVFGAGDTGFGGVSVALTGTSTTGRAVNLTTQSDSQGQYSFTNLLPGQYSLNSSIPTGYIGSDSSDVTTITLGEGQTSVSPTEVTGLLPTQISLAYFLSVNYRGYNLPGSGTGSSSSGFTLATAALSNQTLASHGTTFVDLSGHFLDPDTTSTHVTFHTSVGDIGVTLDDAATPQTVANFLNYIQSGAYTDTLFHRLDNVSTSLSTPYNIIQGGLDDVATDASGTVTSFAQIPFFQSIQNESNNSLRPNVAGTIAMARTTAVNSASSQFYFNLTNNATTLGGQANGQGYTVFGTVDAGASMTNLAKFAASYTPQPLTLGTTGSQPTVPVQNGVSPPITAGIGAPVTDLAVVTSVTIDAPPTGHISYTVQSSNPLVTASLGSLVGQTDPTLPGLASPNQLQLTAGALGAGQTATSVITVSATDLMGETTTSTFTVKVNGV